MDEAIRQKAKRLRAKADSLHVLHKGAAALRHGIYVKKTSTNRKGWEVYYPTHFIYAFFVFNTLYSIDWEQSFEAGDITKVPKREVIDYEGKKHMVEERETTKQQKYLDFCTKDDRFVQLYKRFFIKMILGKQNNDDIHESLSHISPKVIKGKAKANKEYIKKFTDIIDELVFEGKIDRKRIDKMLDFVYKVRCNVFHGSKTVEDMQEFWQQERLDIYASIVIALNQMVFSYLDYLIEGEAVLVKSLKGLYKELSQ